MNMEIPSQTAEQVPLEIVSSQWPVGALFFELVGTNLNGVQFDVRKPILKFPNSISCPCMVFLKIGRGLYFL